MVVSQTIAALTGLVVLLPIALTDLPSVNLRLPIRPDATVRSVTLVDHRRVVDARLPPYSAIGKFRGTKTCTAAIVLNPRIIVTAGHCITEKNGTTRRSNLSFQLGYQTGTDLGRFEAALWAVGSKQGQTHESINDASRDWAILILDRAPAGVRPFLLSQQLPKALASLEQQILLPAYSLDLLNAETLSVDSTCVIRDVAWDTLVHTCSAKSGSSGAPLLLLEGSAYAVVGIHTGSIFASDEDGRVGKFVGNQATASWTFSEAVQALSRQLDAVQTANSAEY